MNKLCAMLSSSRSGDEASISSRLLFDLLDLCQLLTKNINKAPATKAIQTGTIPNSKDAIISSNKKGDPTIYKITVKLKYNIEEDEKIILRNEIIKQTTYNNIDDKFELLKKEDNMTKNLSEKFAEEI